MGIKRRKSRLSGKVDVRIGKMGRMGGSRGGSAASRMTRRSRNGGGEALGAMRDQVQGNCHSYNGCIKLNVKRQPLASMTGISSA